MDLEKITNLEQPKQEDESDQEDAISLCDLSTDHNYKEFEYDTFQFNQDSEEYDDNFEFSFNNLFVTNKNDDTVSDLNDGINFCGKIIGNKQESVNTVENQRRLKKSASSQTSHATGSYRHRYGSSRCSSRKHMALIGLVKIPTEMDLSDIKRRQSKLRNPTTPKLPVDAVGQPAVAGDDGRGGSEIEKRRNNRWSVVRSLRCGSRFANVFAKTAFGCFSFSLVRVFN